MRWRVWSHEATNPRLHQPIRRRWVKGGATKNQEPRTENQELSELGTKNQH